jgi:TolB-like protein/Tfp pilus assembly protein PilF
MDQRAPITNRGLLGSGGVRFGTFDLDLLAGELRKAGVKIKLYGQPFSVLATLLGRPGEVVTREELQQKLWAGDTFVDFEHGLNKAINKVREALGDDADNPRFIETLPRRGYRFIASVKDVSTVSRQPSTGETLSSAKRPGAIDSLAVLPLENASGDPDADYLSDGIAERLTNSLAQLHKIRVVPRTVAFRHRGLGVDALAAGRALGVRAVLAGRMVQRGGDLIVSVELVDVKQEAQLWGAQYSRKVSDLVALQEELTTEISERLRLQLTEAQHKRLRKRPTHSDEAYRLFLKAMYCNINEWPLGARKAIAFCQQAVAIDPRYAAAYAGLSIMFTNLSFFSLAPTVEVMAPARAAARKALELDDTLGEAHISLGYVCLMDWDFAGAEREIQRGLELHPDSVPGYTYLMAMLWARGRFAEALTAAKRATELDPSSSALNRNVGLSLYFLGAFDRAAEQFGKTLESDPHNSLIHALLAEQYACAGQLEKAIEKCAEALALDPRVMFVRMNVAATYARADRTLQSRRIVEESEKAWKVGDGSSWWIAAVHARLGDTDAAFEWLERAFDERATFLVFLKFHPLFDALHGDPRFDDLVKRIGIPD